MEDMVQVPRRILESILDMEDEGSPLAIEVGAILEDADGEGVPS